MKRVLPFAGNSSAAVCCIFCLLFCLQMDVFPLRFCFFQAQFVLVHDQYFDLNQGHIDASRFQLLHWFEAKTDKQRNQNAIEFSLDQKPKCLRKKRIQIIEVLRACFRTNNFRNYKKYRQQFVPLVTIWGVGLQLHLAQRFDPRLDKKNPPWRS